MAAQIVAPWGDRESGTEFRTIIVLDIAFGDGDDGGRLGRDVDLIIVAGIDLWRGLALETGDRRRDGILVRSPPSLQNSTTHLLNGQTCIYFLF